MKWQYLFRRRRLEQDLDDELRFAFQREIDEQVAAGMSEEQARMAASREFGSLTFAREATRESWGWGRVERAARDMRYAARVLSKAPGFAAAAVFILALAIGANTAVFILVDALVLKPLPVEKPNELVYFSSPSFSYPVFEQVRDRAGIFSGFFAWNVDRLNVDWRGGALEPSDVLLATGDFHRTLGVRAVVGRLIEPADDRVGGGPSGRVAVISYGSWQTRFGGSNDVLGRTVRVDNAPFTIVGVTPREFFGVAVGLAPEITLPVAAGPIEAESLRQTSSSWLHLMGRLKPGVTMPQAEAAKQVFWPQVLEATTNPNAPANRRARYLSTTTTLEPARTGFSRVRRQFAEPLWLLFALVGLLLLVSCASVANLLLARASARRHEFAVRVALGAGRGRLVQQLACEGLLLSSIGGAAGYLIGAWGSRALIALLSTTEDPIALALAADWRVMAFAAAAVALTTLLFTIAPAVRASVVDPAGALSSARTTGVSRQRARLNRSLVLAQVALSMILLSGAALFARSLNRILSVDLGFEPQRLAVIGIDGIAAGHRGDRLARFYEDVLDRLRRVPGVQSASLSFMPPVSNEMGSWTQAIAVDGIAQPESERFTYFNAVSPGYFRTVGIPLIRGVDFEPDRSHGRQSAVVINEALAQRYFPGRDPIGHRISIGRDARRQDLEVIGLVRDSKYQRLQEPSRSIAYLSHTSPSARGSNLVVEIRTATDASVADAALREIRAVDPIAPIRFETASARIAESLVTERAFALIAAALGAVGLLLASAGLYGLIAYTVTRRTNEIGLRLTLGASRGAVLWMMLRESLLLTSIGVLVGVAAAQALGRFASKLVFGVTPGDPATLAGAVLIMIAVTTCAALIPARRAAAIDPAAALRQE